MSIKIRRCGVQTGATHGSFLTAVLPGFVGDMELNHTRRGECLTDLVLVPLVTHI